jgi:hypothetical protein
MNRFKINIKTLLIIPFLISGFNLFSQDITITAINGIVQVKKSENADWQTASAGQVLQIGNFIFTGFNSTAVLKTINAEIEVKPLSQMSIASLIKNNENVETDIYLKYGKPKATVSKSEEVKTIFKVRSANSTASVRGTVFTFGDDELVVEEGTVYLLNDNDYGILVQGNEKADSSKLSTAKSPPQRKVEDHVVTVKPIGIADIERLPGITVKDRIQMSGVSKVIITIKVKR